MRGRCNARPAAIHVVVALILVGTGIPHAVFAANGAARPEIRRPRQARR